MARLKRLKKQKGETQMTKIKKIENGNITQNPFHEDDFSMGTQLSEELFFMHMNFPREPLKKGAYIYNIKTGERFSISIE